MWWAYYLFGVAATGAWLNWTVVGPIFLNLLFLPPMASLDLTEALSSRKYPAYPEYQVIPAFFSSKRGPFPPSNPRLPRVPGTRLALLAVVSSRGRRPCAALDAGTAMPCAFAKCEARKAS